MTKRTIPSRRDLLATGAGVLATSILPRPVFSQGAPVKVGVILYLSGVQAFMGQQTRKGNDFGAKVVKEAGGPAMEFIYGDAESKPENGRIVAERLIREGCTLLIGTNDSGSTISVSHQHCLCAPDHRAGLHADLPQLHAGGHARRQCRHADQGAWRRNRR
jgi:branched-chain amino acid transport system substrate-binding protein